MNFTDTTLFKLSNLFGMTEITLLLSKDDLDVIKDEMDSVVKRGSFTANTGLENTVAAQLGMEMYKVNNTTINLCDREKFIEMFLTEKSDG